MRTAGPSPLPWALLAALTVAGCGSATEAVSPSGVPVIAQGAVGASDLVRGRPLPRNSGWMTSSAKGTPLVFVSDEGLNAVQIYQRSHLDGAPVGQITDGIDVPDGMCVDIHGNLVVTNAHGNSLTVYPPGEVHPSQTITSGMATPVNVACGKDGALYVVDLNGGSAYVNVFPPGGTTPSLTLTGPTGLAAGIAVDRRNRVYVSYHDSSGHGWVYRYNKGSTKGTDLKLATHTPAGLALDSKDNLIVADETLPAAIEVFPPGATQPSQVLTNGIGNPFLIALDRKQKRLFATDEYHVGVDIAAYPTLSFLMRMTQGLQVPAGVAVTPPARL